MKITGSTIIASIALLTPAWAQQKANAHAGHHTPTLPPAAADGMTEPEVRKIAIDAAKITLKHTIKSLDMPGLTMVFNVRDKAALGELKVGPLSRLERRETSTSHQGARGAVSLECYEGLSIVNAIGRDFLVYSSLRDAEGIAARAPVDWALA